MVSDWDTYPISDFVTLSQGLAINAKSKYLLEETGLPLLRITDLINGTQVHFVNEEKVSPQCIATDHELIYTRTGQVGLVYRNKVGVVHNNCFKVIPSLELDKDFLYWFLFQKSTKAHVNAVASGSVQKDLNHAAFLTLEIPRPKLSEQKAIASILDSLDDKIELNRQMNETLEAMAQALFKSWFVDFDPVIDNALAAGNAIPDEFIERAEQRKAIEKKDNSDIQGLFPDEFEFTEEMGWIPKGWGVGALDNMFELQRGFDLPKTKRTDGLYPLMAASGQDGTHYEYKVKGPGVITGRSGKLGVVSFVNANYWPLNTTLWVKNYNQSNPYHAYFFLQTLDLEKYNSGSAVPSLNRNNVHNLVQILPSKIVLDKFQEVVKSSFAKIAENNTGIETLAKLRDTLLPKLMSGEVRISDAAELVDEVL